MLMDTRPSDFVIRSQSLSRQIIVMLETLGIQTCPMTACYTKEAFDRVHLKLVFNIKNL